MNQDDYQKKIDEHRQSIGIEDETVELRRSRRANSSKKPKKKPKNVLIPTLFFIFILIPVCIFIYVQFFYTAETNDTADAGIIHVETNTISNNQQEKKEEEAQTEDESSEEVEQTPTQAPEKEVKEEEQSQEETKTEDKQEQKTEVKQEPKVETPSKTHIVKENETLYRIAVNYYNNPEAVEKIKAANGLTSNNISAGQKLILP